MLNEALEHLYTSKDVVTKNEALEHLYTREPIRLMRICKPC